LAFAVAAHLEPEILIVDEVLAVGDAEFQKKAIGKMQDVSAGGGRTVLFVSHNMTSLQALCQRGIVLNNGSISFEGDIYSAVDHYMANANATNVSSLGESGRYGVQINEVSIRTGQKSSNKIEPNGAFSVLVKGKLFEAQSKFDVNFAIYNEKNIKITQFGTRYHSFNTELSAGELNLEFRVDDNPLAPGSYYLNFAVSNEHGVVMHVSNIVNFDIVPEAFSTSDKYPKLGESIIMLRTELIAS
jgi:lipopolysaccharide transport system ATP-binding protein